MRMGSNFASFVSLVFPANDLTRSPPSERRALLSKRLERARYGR